MAWDEIRQWKQEQADKGMYPERAVPQPSSSYALPNPLKPLEQRLVGRVEQSSIVASIIPTLVPMIRAIS
jgi:hypothetical protein